MSGESLVGVRHSVNLLLDEDLVEGVKVDLLGGAVLEGHARASAHDGAWHADVVEGGVVHGLEGARAGTLLRGVRLCSLRLDGAVGNHEHGPLELSFHVVDDLGGDLLVEGEGAVGDLDENVLGGGAVSLLVLNHLDGVDEHELEGGSELTIGGGLEGGENLGGLFFEVSRLHTLLLLKFAAVEHRVLLENERKFTI